VKDDVREKFHQSLREALLEKEMKKIAISDFPKVKQPDSPAATRTTSLLGSTTIESTVPFFVGQEVWIPVSDSSDEYIKGLIREVSTAVKLVNGKSVREDKIVVSFRKKRAYGNVTNSRKTFTLSQAQTRIARSESDVKLMVVTSKLAKLEKARKSYMEKHDKQKLKLDQEKDKLELEMSKNSLSGSKKVAKSGVKSGKSFAHLDVG